MDLHQKSAVAIRDAFLSGAVSATEIVQHFLQRAKKNQDKTGAFLKILSDRALAKAKALDEKKAKGEPLGKMAAIPVAVKDNIHIKGEITTCGSKHLENFKAPFSASCVHFMEKEDALIIGKTNLDEFAMGSSNENSAYFPSHNPWNLTKSPGGSSGGSASSVAARLAMIALGSDTGGSIRQPASFCGVVGFKPTYGRVSRYGLVAFGSSFDQIGPLSSCVGDAALTMEVIGRQSERDATTLDLPMEAFTDRMPKDLKGLIIGVPWHYLECLSQEPKDNFQKALQALETLGAKLIDIDLSGMKYSIATYYIIATAEASTNLARFDGIRYGMRSKEAKFLHEIYDKTRDEGLGKEVKKRIMLGTYVLSSGFHSDFYTKAQKVRTKIIREFDEAFQSCDLIVTPTTPGAAFKSGSIQDPVEMYLQDIFTISANLAGLPSVSVPSGFSLENMPYGLQITGPQLQDMEVLRAAHAFETATVSFPQIPKEFQ
jgi:aspartyl-tRNA(Asn)/glutamyl-tRNA(Gln) amidotransferase subunit A